VLTSYICDRMSYGTGRPAILKDDETIEKCDLMLEHPLSNEDDMRLVSTVELMAARERWQNAMGPLDQSVEERTFDIASRAREEFKGWYDRWDQRFAKKYPDRGMARLLDFANSWLTFQIRRFILSSES
jgi:hypothetical protein